MDFANLAASKPEKTGCIPIPDNTLPEYEIDQFVEEINVKERRSPQCRKTGA